ncbi:hypothetical protein Anapl_18935 [Anas platyrhynchos]|uniref:Uncharacterized protein n=1 Tax=Anas platyrhynchos TaxID=8839 RepID=R0JKP8_ANAPL|nr:hypothetical protein Anapl_18935 [Anas platyrhynchos]
MIRKLTTGASDITKWKFPMIGEEVTVGTEVRAVYRYHQCVLERSKRQQPQSSWAQVAHRASPVNIYTSHNTLLLKITQYSSEDNAYLPKQSTTATGTTLQQLLLRNNHPSRSTPRDRSYLTDELSTLSCRRLVATGVAKRITKQVLKSYSLCSAECFPKSRGVFIISVLMVLRTCCENTEPRRRLGGTCTREGNLPCSDGSAGCRKKNQRSVLDSVTGTSAVVVSTGADKRNCFSLDGSGLQLGLCLSGCTLSKETEWCSLTSSARETNQQTQAEVKGLQLAVGPWTIHAAIARPGGAGPATLPGETVALYYSSDMLPFTFSNSNCCDLADMYLQEEGDWKSVEIGQEKKTRTCANGRKHKQIVKIKLCLGQSEALKGTSGSELLYILQNNPNWHRSTGNKPFWVLLLNIREHQSTVQSPDQEKCCRRGLLQPKGLVLGCVCMHPPAPGAPGGTGGAVLLGKHFLLHLHLCQYAHDSRTTALCLEKEMKKMNSAVFVTQAVLTVKIQYSMRINRPEEYKSKSLNKQTKNNVESKPDLSTGIHPVLAGECTFNTEFTTCIEKVTWNRAEQGPVQPQQPVESPKPSESNFPASRFG